jgi:hypothetical protein
MGFQALRKRENIRQPCRISPTALSHISFCSPRRTMAETYCRKVERGVTIRNVLSPSCTHTDRYPFLAKLGRRNDANWVGMAKIGSEKSKKGVRGVAMPVKLSTPLGIQPGSQDNNTLSCPQVASSVMNNFYDVIIASRSFPSSVRFVSAN